MINVYRILTSEAIFLRVNLHTAIASSVLGRNQTNHDILNQKRSISKSV